jgi:tetratricopeptide (TPR) repeat protein
VAVLPFADETGSLDLAWTTRALAERLTAGLAESGGLRVVDHLRVLRRLKALRTTSSDLRPSQLRQLGKTFQIDHLVMGRLTKVEEILVMEGQLLELTGEEPSSRALPIQKGDPAQIFDLLEGLRLDLLGALELEPQADEGRERHRPVISAMVAYSEGLDLLSSGEAPLAAAALVRAVAEDPKLASGWMRLAQTRSDLGKQAEALDAARQAVRVAEGNLRLSLQARGQEALLRGDPTAAQEVLETLVSNYPFDAEARLSLAEAFGQQGRFTDAIGHLERAVELDNGNPRSWYLLGRYAIGVGELRRAVDEYLVRALVLENTLRNETGQALVLNALGVGYQRLGLLDQANENYQKAATIRRRVGDAPGLISTLRNLVWVNLAQGAFDRAESNIQNALEVQEEIGDPSGLGEVYNTYGVLEEERGRYPEALQRYRRSLQFRRDLGDERALAESHNNVGYTYYLLAEYDNALLHLEKALDLHRQNEQQSGIVRTLQSVGFCRIAQGGWSGADSAFREALDLARELEERLAVTVSLGNLGRVAQFQGRYTEAFSRYREALDLLMELEDQRGLVEFNLYEAETTLELGDLDTTEEVLAQVEDWLSQGGNREQQARLQLLEGHLHLQKGELESATENFRAALADAETSHSPVTALEAQLGAGYVALADHRFEEARQLLEPILSAAEQLDHTRLRLQSAEAIATAQSAMGDFTGAQENLRTALRLVASGGSYAGTFRLYSLLAEVLEASQDPEAAARARRDAQESLESLRNEIGPEHQETFDALPAVARLLG